MVRGARKLSATHSSHPSNKLSHILHGNKVDAFSTISLTWSEEAHQLESSENNNGSDKQRVVVLVGVHSHCDMEHVVWTMSFERSHLVGVCPQLHQCRYQSPHIHFAESTDTKDHREDVLEIEGWYRGGEHVWSNERTC